MRHGKGCWGQAIASKHLQKFIEFVLQKWHLSPSQRLYVLRSHSSYVVAYRRRALARCIFPPATGSGASCWSKRRSVGTFRVSDGISEGQTEVPDGSLRRVQLQDELVHVTSELVSFKHSRSLSLSCSTSDSEFSKSSNDQNACDEVQDTREVQISRRVRIISPVSEEMHRRI